MNVRHFAPYATLRPFIKSYVIIESEHGIENTTLPDTSPVIAIRFRGEVSVKENGQNHQLPSAVISGIRHTAKYIHYTKQSANLLIIFHTGGTAAFFNEPLHELSGLSVALDNFKTFAQAPEISERLSAAKDHRERIKLIDQILIGKLKTQRLDPLVFHAAEKIRLGQGGIRVKELMETLPISRDAFEKKFRRIVGTSPKQFSNIIRMRTLLEKGKGNKSLTDLAYEAGYFDQSHFIKDFKLFTGQTPSQFFKSPAFW